MRRLGGVVFALLLFAVCVSPVEAATADKSAQDPTAQAQGVLDKRVRSVRDRDREAFASTIDPMATEAFRASQMTAFEGLASLPIADLQMTIRTDDSGDLAPGLDLSARPGITAAFLPQTRIGYRLDGFDPVPAVVTEWWTFVERNGAWFVSSDDDAAVVGMESERDIWSLGALTVQRTDHFLLVTKSASQARLEGLGAAAEDGYAKFASTWSQPWFGRIPMFVPESVSEAEWLLGGRSNLGNFAAFVVFRPYREDVWKTTAPRFFAQQIGQTDVSPSARSRFVDTVVHELTHAAEASRSGPFTPTWLHEGMAEWQKFGRPKVQSPDPGLAGELPASNDFSSVDSGTVRRAYGAATSAVAYISERFGSEAVFRLFDEIGSRRQVAGSSSFHVDEAFRKVLGLSIDDFQTAWSSRYPP